MADTENTSGGGLPESVWASLNRSDPEPIHRPLSDLSSGDLQELRRTLENTHPDPSNAEQTRVVDAYRSLVFDAASQEALGEIRDRVARELENVIREDTMVKRAAVDWDKLSFEEKKTVLGKVEEGLAKAYGQRFETSYFDLPGGTSGENVGGRSAVNLADKSFAHAIEVVTHESQHSFQRILAGSLDNLPDERLRSAAEIFKLNLSLNRRGAVGSNGLSFAYGYEPIEMDARNAGYSAHTVVTAAATAAEITRHYKADSLMAIPVGTEIVSGHTVNKTNALTFGFAGTPPELDKLKLLLKNSNDIHTSLQEYHGNPILVVLEHHAEEFRKLVQTEAPDVKLYNTTRLDTRGTTSKATYAPTPPPPTYTYATAAAENLSSTYGDRSSAVDPDARMILRSGEAADRGIGAQKVVADVGDARIRLTPEQARQMAAAAGVNSSTIASAGDERIRLNPQQAESMRVAVGVTRQVAPAVGEQRLSPSPEISAAQEQIRQQGLDLDLSDPKLKMPSEQRINLNATQAAQLRDAAGIVTPAASHDASDQRINLNAQQAADMRANTNGVSATPSAPINPPTGSLTNQSQKQNMPSRAGAKTGGVLGAALAVHDMAESLESGKGPADRLTTAAQVTSIASAGAGIVESAANIAAIATKAAAATNALATAQTVAGKLGTAGSVGAGVLIAGHGVVTGNNQEVASGLSGTAGAILGAKAGAAVGATWGAAIVGTAGSVIPVAGTVAGIAVGGAVGGVVGGLLGGVAGSKALNTIAEKAGEVGSAIGLAVYDAVHAPKQQEPTLKQKRDIDTQLTQNLSALENAGWAKILGNGDTKLSLDELKDTLKKHNITMKDLDKDGDGKITGKEITDALMPKMTPNAKLQTVAAAGRGA